jgi:nucleoid DNA-binding protein
MSDPFDKTELSGAISKEFELSPTAAKNVIDLIFEKIQAALSEGRTVELHEIGAFRLKEKAARKGRVPDGNPDGIQEGAEWETPPRLKVVFKAYTAFAEHIGEKLGKPVY